MVADVAGKGVMNSHKKVRLILVNNSTASLFMASWFVQNNYDKDTSWENIAIYCSIDLNEAFSNNIESIDWVSIETKKNVYEQFNFHVFKNLVNDWYVCMPNEYDSYQFSLMHPLRIL